MKRKHYFLHCLLIALLFCVLPFTTYAQDRAIKGTVVDENGAPLPGVTVLIKGTQTGTVTDFDGKYQLGVTEGVTLVFSYVGYLPKEIVLATQTVLDVQMEVDSEQLEEVVVVGYGVQKKSEVTGSISKVSSESLTDIPVPSFEAGLQGKASGVQVIQGSGLAGSASVIRVRGVGSISAAGDPLYVIDGIPVTQDYFLSGNRGGMNNNPLAALNPNDIESVEILKDASAAGIYGSRGANGVILITTKRGKAGKPKYDFSTRIGFSEPSIEPVMQDTKGFLTIWQEAWENEGNTGLAPLPNNVSWEDAVNTNTDWRDITTQTGFNQEYNFSVNAGTEKFKAYAGVSFTDQDAYIEGSEFSRLSVRANVDWQATTNFKVGLSTSFTNALTKRVDVFSTYGGFLSTALPIYTIYTDSSQTEFRRTGLNPARHLAGQDFRKRELRTINTLTLEYKLLEDLIIRGVGSIDYMDLRDVEYQTADFLGRTTEDGENGVFPVWVQNYNANITASYLWDINENHKLNFLLGFEYQYSSTEKYNKITIRNQPRGLWEDNWNYSQFSDATLPDGSSAYIVEDTGDQNWSFLSYFLRVNYTAFGKINLQGTARVDGSSRFGRNNRYGFFPTLSAGWTMTNEPWMQDQQAISLLKLKASWGITGNSNIDNYAQFGTFEPSTNSIRYNNLGTTFPVRLENPDLQWETTNTVDLGVELNFIQDRIQTEFSAYFKKTEDVLINVTLPPSIGFSNQWQNVGRIDNNGLELSITSRNLVNEFKWTTVLNIARNNNEVKSIGNLSEDAVSGGTNDTRIRVGHPVGANFVVRYARTEATGGLPVWLDLEDNETQFFTPDNRVVAGSVIPDAVGGLDNRFEYKNWDFSFMFAFTVNGNIYDGSAKRQLGTFVDGDNSWNMRSEIQNRWRAPGDTRAPRAFFGSTVIPGLSSVWQYNSSLYLYDASYLRLRNISLGYTFPAEKLENSFLSYLRFNFTATNLLTWRKYPGGDPEIARDFENAQDRNLSPNVTYLTPPQAKSYTISINLSF